MRFGDNAKGEVTDVWIITISPHVILQKYMWWIMKPLQSLHIDLFRSTKIASISGKRYAVIVVDDYSCFT